MILETERLVLREFTIEDARFIYELVNEPAWLEFIGDKGIRSIKDAENFIENKLRASYSEYGFGFYNVILKETGESTGMCGLVDRPGLENIDIGFAFLAKFRKKGFGYESASAMLKYANETLKIPKIVAITNLENVASGKLLEKIGLRFERIISLKEDEKDECRLYVQDLR